MRSSLKLCLSLAFFFLLLSAPSFALTYITDCTFIIEPGEYVLANDIIDARVRTCIQISANNVTLDCQGHTIDSFWWYYDFATTGIIINANNTTIKNCFLTDWTYALHTYGYYNNLINSTISNYESLIESSNGTIININVYGLQGAPPWAGKGWGIYVYGSFNTLINVSLDSCIQGLWIGGYNTLINITAKNNDERGLLIKGNNNTIINSTFISNGRSGVRIDTFNNTIKNSKFLNNTRGIEFYGASYNLFYNNLFDNNAVHVEILFGGQPYVNYWNTTLQLGPNIIGGPYIGGNYWGGYSDICNSTRINGICDDPYGLPYGGGVDYLPLSSHFTPITTTTTLPPVTVIYEKGLPFPPLVILLMILFILIMIVGAAFGLKRK